MWALGQVTPSLEWASLTAKWGKAPNKWLEEENNIMEAKSVTLSTSLRPKTGKFRGDRSRAGIRGTLVQILNQTLVLLLLRCDLEQVTPLSNLFSPLYSGDLLVLS